MGRISTKTALHVGQIAYLRTGKYLEIRLSEGQRAKAGEQVREMCTKLLANPVIENFRFELGEVAG